MNKVNRFFLILIVGVGALLSCTEKKQTSQAELQKSTNFNATLSNIASGKQASPDFVKVNGDEIIFVYENTDVSIAHLKSLCVNNGYIHFQTN